MSFTPARTAKTAKKRKVRVRSHLMPVLARTITSQVPQKEPSQGTRPFFSPVMTPSAIGGVYWAKVISGRMKNDRMRVVRRGFISL
jgi:hypothetical protein